MSSMQEQVAAKLEDIKTNPDKHRHEFGELQECCAVDGIIVLSLMNAHQQYVPLGSNGGQPCDVSKGPCSCGAWH